MRTQNVLRCVAITSIIAAAGCQYPYTPNDGGDGAWVEQVVPALLGRKPINAIESRVLVEIAHQRGREAVVDVLLSAPELDGYWSIVLADMMKLQRGGIMPQGTAAQQATCWNTPMLYSNPATDWKPVAAALSTQVNPKQNAGFPANFNMADVLRSAIARDDLFAPWRAQLFSLGDYGRAHKFEAGGVFLSGFTNRNSECLGCHQSTFSTAKISPIPLDLDGSIFPQGSTSAANVYLAFEDTGTPTVQLLGRMHGSCGRLFQTGQPDGYNSQGGGTEFAGLTPPTNADYDVMDLDAALLAGKTQLTETDIGTEFSTQQAPGCYFPNLSTQLDGPRAFAAALALSTTEAIIKELEGHGLTLPHGHPRVDEQRYYLQGYAYTLVATGWSLRFLLKSLVMRGTFNMLPPNQAQSAYPFPMFFNGWAKQRTACGEPDLPATDASENANGQGDIVHRYSVPSLLTSVHHSLGWTKPVVSPEDGVNIPEFSSKRFHGEVGRPESLMRRGNSDVDFGGLLAWERTVGTCQTPSSPTVPAAPDWIDSVMATVLAPGAPVYTLRDVVTAFKDRFVQDQTIEESETTADPGIEGEPGPALEPPPSQQHDVDWNDADAAVARIDKETASASLRADQRDAASVQAAAFAEAQASNLVDVEDWESNNAWRFRYDDYTEALNDPEWSQKWWPQRDALDNGSAAKMLDVHGSQKSYWKKHFLASEADLLAEYFGVSSIDFPAAQIPDLESKLRGYCGSLLTSPQFMLGGMRPAQAAADPVPNLLVCLPGQSAYCDEHQLCTHYASLAAAHGHGPIVCPP